MAQDNSQAMLDARAKAIDDLAADLAILDTFIRMLAKRGASKRMAHDLRTMQDEWTEHLEGMRARNDKAQRDAWVTPDLSK